ncbi:hypothetical protein DGM98_17225 [Xanthomonas citri]|uniref:Uncharacterized protein n=1 Tax=Xanthomonas citri pv. phaseoli var. fuscans TaxID=473423 RepID=A0AB33FED9_XANCI|nr:hypothetical protein DGM98_17225 [Xanthomonas citri]
MHRKTATAHHWNARNIGGGNHIVGHARILNVWAGESSGSPVYDGTVTPASSARHGRAGSACRASDSRIDA